MQKEKKMSIELKERGERMNERRGHKASSPGEERGW
jgi:hypothetical protein